MRAAALIETLTAGTFASWDMPIADPATADPAYRESLRRARGRTGVDESVLTGVGRVGSTRIALIVSEFGFLGGSIGEAAGARIVAALRRATAKRLPVLAAPASGGTRMQEGAPAFLQMVSISAAVAAHRDAGLPYLVYLRHPTTGGVFASWGSMGQVTWAQPHALIGFLGPRVYEGLHGTPFPDDIQTAENLLRRRLVDEVVAPYAVADRLSQLLSVLVGSAKCLAPQQVAEPLGPVADAWSAVRATRAPHRPGLREVLDALPHSVICGPGALLIALADFGGRRAVVVGHDRAAEAVGYELIPADLVLAQRGIALAAQWRIPVVTVIDTAGAALSVDAENDGLAGQIAACMNALLATAASSVAVLLGQGTGGAALALFPADYVIAADDAWLSPLPPEGASLIMHHNIGHAAEMVGPQRIWSHDLRDVGVVDVVLDPTQPLVRAVTSAISDRLGGDPQPTPERRTRL